MKAELPDGYTPNSANPVFRKILLHAITSSSWNSATSDAEIRSMMDTFTKDVLGKWRATCPDTGAYISESDILKPNFSQAIYGTNYERLYKLKQRYDLSSLFYTPTGVGSEKWVVQSEDGLPDQNGRFCRI